VIGLARRTALANGAAGAQISGMKDMAAFPAHPADPPTPRDYHGINWTGAITLYQKEVKRFWKVGMQTLMAPVVTTVLYLMVFGVATQGARPPVAGTPFVLFMGPGLIMMQIIGSAFANSASSLMQAKMMGLTQDFLTPPLTPTEQVAAFALGAATRGIIVGVVSAISVYLIVVFADHLPVGVAHWWAVLYFGVGASMLTGLVGVVAGLWAEKFDHLAAVTNFFIMPMSFLSGTFYTTDRLHEPFRTLSHYNPFYYMIAGFRYGFIGHADGSIGIGVAAIAGLTLVLGAICWWLFQTGYRLKS
jgi:ABC-2 type transport system permease protein